MMNQNYQNPYGFQQPYQGNMQQTQPMQQQMTVPNQILAWVRSEEEAINFPLGIGQSIFLMNQNDNYLYMKSVDQLGKQTFIKKRLIDESDNQEPKINLNEYIRKEEIEDVITNLVQKIVDKKMSEFSFKPTKTKKQVIVDEED